MDYKKIYYDFCDKCKKTKPRERLKKKSPNDTRLREEILYTEIHHIVPVSLGGSNNSSNLVEVLPEEHFLLHLIRYKAYKDRQDFLAVRFMLNGYESRKDYLDLEILNRGPMYKRIGLYRSMIQKFRTETGWQTSDGKKRISEARRGTFPCVDAITRESVGSHSKNHPKILSGEWVHHSKGMVNCILIDTQENVFITSEEYRKNRNLYKSNKDSRGEKNANFKPLTEEIKDWLIDNVGNSLIDENHFKTNLFFENVYQKFKDIYKKPPGGKWLNNHGIFIQDLIKEYNLKYQKNVVYDRFYRSVEQKQKAKIDNSNQMWINNGLHTIRIKKHELENYLQKGYVRGRLK